MATKSEIREREVNKAMAEDVVAMSQAGPIEKVSNLKMRQRAIYWRPFRKENGEIEWQPTKLLPSDALGRELYLSKGFRLKPPSQDSTTPEVTMMDTEKEDMKAEIARLKAKLAEKPAMKHRRRRTVAVANQNNGGSLSGTP